MQEADLKNLGQLFEKAGDGTDEDEWQGRFEDFVKQAMADHATRLKNGLSDAQKQAEAFRAKFSLLGIVEERLNARCEAKDPGISKAMTALQEAQGGLFQEVITAIGQIPDSTSVQACESKMSQSQNTASSASATTEGALNLSSYGGSPEPLTLQVDFEDLSSPDAPEDDIISPQAVSTVSPNRPIIFQENKKCNSYAKRHQKTKSVWSVSGQQEGRGNNSSGAKDLSLMQLMNFIASIYQSKAGCDSKANPDHIQPMEMFFYAYLAQHYGMHAVKEWAEIVFNAIKKFCDKEVRVAAFGKILQNRLAEDFPRTIETLSKTLQDSFREKIEETNPGESAEALWQAAQQGRDRFGLPLSACGDIILHLYNADDGQEVMRRLQQECKKYVDDTSNALPPDCIGLRGFCQAVCIFQMNLTENFLSDFISMFNAVNEEVQEGSSSAGTLESGQLTELVRRLSHVQGLAHAQSASLLEARERATAHALRVRRATFSQCVNIFSDLISARWGAIQSSLKR